MPTIIELAKQYRAALLRREAAASADVLRAFKLVLTNLEPKIKALEAAFENEPDMSLSRVFRLERYKALQAQTKSEIERFAGQAAYITEQAQTVNVAHAFRESSLMIETATDAFVKLPTRAINSFIGLASDGSPLVDIFKDISKGAAQAVKDKLTVSIALGHNPRKTASEIRRSFGTPAARALVIARTESLRSYRTANLEVMRENSNLVGGWYWLSARSRRTCALCWAMDGTHHKLTESFASHPVCRCSQIADIGKPLAKTGTQIFASLDEANQLDILGAGKFELYKSGKIELSDLVETKTDARWGKVRTEKSLRAL